MPDGSLNPTLLAVRALDLDWIVARLMRAHGWDEERAARAVDHYRCVLEIAAEHPDRPIAPPTGADMAWHEHMLNTQRYVADCFQVFGEFIHHDPELCGTPAFWDAWDFTREQFAARRGVALPPSAEMQAGHPDDLPIRRDQRGAVANDVMPKECIVMPRAVSAATPAEMRPKECILMPRRGAA